MKRGRKSPGPIFPKSSRHLILSLKAKGLTKGFILGIIIDKEILIKIYTFFGFFDIFLQCFSSGAA
jgi:hypothetical protein